MWRAIVAMVVCAASIAWADRVYLKDGTVLEGKVKAKTAEKVVFEYERGKYKSLSSSEVERIVRDEFSFPPAEGNNQQNPPEPSGPAPAGWTAETKLVKVATPDGDKEKEITYYTNTVRMKLALIPAGTFMMGETLSPEEMMSRWPLIGVGDPGWGKRVGRPAHRVSITRGFYMGAHDVTRRFFARFVRESSYRTEAEKKGKASAFKNGEWEDQDGVNWRNPLFEQTDDHPVVCVSWNDANSFCDWISKKEGLEYRLPTEAEWEYAARAGSAASWYWGEDESGAQGRAKIIFDGVHYASWRTARVGSLTPNAFGLYDMIGNVRTWCADWHSDFYYGESPGADPTGPDSGHYRVVRGGSWSDIPRDARSAYRGGCCPDARVTDLGFRVVCSER